jgi:DNA-binding transcriptional ArsR family regulator
MSGLEEETYSTMFLSLRHPARRKILRMLAEKSRSFSEILEELGISSSHLTYHLENLGELVSKIEDGRYKLSTFGEAAVAAMSKVEEAPKAREPKHALPLPMKWKSFFAALVIGLVILASVCSLQYQSLNQILSEYKQLRAEHEQISREYEQLKELVALTHSGDVSLQSEYTLSYHLRWEDNGTSFIVGPLDCLIYSLYDNSTFYLGLSINQFSLRWKSRTWHYLYKRATLMIPKPMRPHP